MKTTLYIIGLAALLPSACVKDTLYTTPHPDKGAVVVTADWSGRSSEAAAPESYVVRIGGREHTAYGPTYVFGTLLVPDTYDLLAYTRPDGIAVSGTTASVEQTAAGQIAPHPGYLFASCQQIAVPKDDTLRVTAGMKQYVQRLDLELTVSSGDYARVTSVLGKLTGVETAIDLATGTRSGKPATTTAPFTQQGARFTLFFRLLGIVPTEKQRLTVEIVFSDGSTQSVESDLSAQLAGLDDNPEPLKLTGDLLLPLEAGMNGSIEGWEQTDAGNADAQ